MVSYDKHSILKRYFSCAAAILAGTGLCISCATDPNQQWAAHGYLSPAPTNNSEFIGVFENKIECNAAAEGWMSRQVVGNPVFAECLPVDKH